MNQNPTREQASSGPPRALHLRLPGGPAAPSSARAALAEFFSGLASDTRFAADLLLSEVVANGVVHGGAGPADALIVSAVLNEEALRVDVADGGEGFEAAVDPTRGTEEDLGGRGLHLIDGLARRWGVRDGGRAVWFELGLGHATVA
jgi:anti-sigma regulatory factor (Ser/Thr protein kinase)